MNPDLVCKIQVRTADGKIAQGSGYPITPNRIITAAHVVADAMRVESDASAGDARDITLSFGVTGKPVPGPVYIEWSDAGIDVAVLRCELPTELQPPHKLLTTPPSTPIKWFAQGYTDFGKRMRPGGKDGYEGTLTKFSESEATVALGCDAGLIDSKQWAGGSGSVAFDSATAQTALAVITDYEGGKKLDHLIAVPICYLLNFVAIKDRFCTAIGFGSYEKRENHCNVVMKAVALQLMGLDEDRLVTIAGELAQLAGSGLSSIDLTSKKEILAERTASCLVAHAAAADVVSCLTGLIQAYGPTESEIVASIIKYLLPLNYAPDSIRRLAERIGKDQFGFVEDEVSTRTLAEILMAGYDQQPAKFSGLTDDGDLRGHSAIEYQEGPEEGLGDPQAATLGVLRAARNLLRDLLAMKGTLSWSSNQLRRPRLGESEEDGLRRELNDFAISLRGALKGVNTIAKRTSYCVLRLPEESPEREFRIQVLREVSRQVPQLIFVELAPPNLEREREFEVQAYMKHLSVHLIPTQQGRNS